MLPADMLSAMPNADRRAPVSSPASLPAAAAAPNTPQTAVGCSPCRYSSAGPSSSPRLAMTWYPDTALSSNAAVVTGPPGVPPAAAVAASSAVQITVPGWELDGSWVSSSSMLCALIPLTSAASRTAAVWPVPRTGAGPADRGSRSEEHTSELQSPCNLVCRLLLEKKKNINTIFSLYKINIKNKNTKNQ